MKVKLYKLTDKGEEILINESDYPKTIKEAQQSGYYPKSIIDLFKRANVLKQIPEPLKEITKAYKKALEFSKPQQRVLELYNIEHPLKNYLGAYNDLFDSIKIFENNPFLKQEKELKKRVNEYLKAYEDYKNTTFYKEDKKQNKQLIDRLEIEKEILQNKLNTLLDAFSLKNEYQSNKSKTKTNKSLKLSLNPNPLIDLNWAIEVLHKETQPLFTSTFEQWQNLFSTDIQVFKKPIELKQNTTLSDLRYFLNELERNKLIKTKKFNSIIAKTKSFQYENKPITGQQLATALTTLKQSNPVNKDTIDEVFNLLKLTD